MTIRFVRAEEMGFLAVLVTAIILIAVAHADPVAVKIVIDVVIAYWAMRTAKIRARAGREVER
jgi:hypothetical protein